jgi:3-oxoadipate enol-lactonase
MDWIEANGVALRHDVQGTGPATIVLIHEMGGTLESWDMVVPLLRGKRRVVRYDTRGAGLSEKIRGTASIDTMADDLAGLLDALEIKGKVAVAGIAVGAAIALHFAVRHANRTSAVIPMSPAIGMAPERRAATLATVDTMEAQGVRPGIDAGLVPSYPDALRGDASQFARTRAQRLGNDPSSFAAIYRMLVGMDLMPSLTKIALPALVIAGRLDGLRPPAIVEPVAKAIPGAEYVVLETAHFMASQTPELVAGAIVGFLDRAGC